MQSRNGTCDVTHDSASVTINGVTAGASAVAIGQQFKTDIDGDAIYQIASRTPSSGPSLTAITLSAPYGGDSATGLHYQITTDFSVNRGYPLPQQGDGDAADWIAEALRKIDQDIASIVGSVGGGGGIILDQGQIPFWDNGLKGEDEFVYDNTNNRLGLGTATPAKRLHIIIGNSGDDGIYIQGSSGVNAEVVVSDGAAAIALLCLAAAPKLWTDAQVLFFFETNQERMRLDNGRLILGGASVGGGSADIGELVVANTKKLKGLDAAGTTAVGMVSVNSDDQVVISPDGNEIFWGILAVGIGSGANATLGGVGGSGPASTAQSGWMKGTDSTGDFFIPIWR